MVYTADLKSAAFTGLRVRIPPRLPGIIIAMKSISYPIKHQYQPTNTSCSPTALSMLLEYYGQSMSPTEVGKSVPQVRDETGEERGTINTQMATWCISRGFDVTLYTFDCQIIDQPWRKLSSRQVTERLKAGLDGLEVPALGALWSNAYRQAYIDFIQAGGELIIRPYASRDLLYQLLQNGPILPCLSYSTLHGVARTRNINEIDSVNDDVNGRAVNHSVVIYGVDESGNFLIADPWRKPGRHVIEPDQMVAAISTAQLECDNMVFGLTPRKPVQ